MQRAHFIASSLSAAAVAAWARPAPAAVAPGAKLPTSDTAHIGELFAVDYFNWRISKIEWLPDSAPFAKAIGADSSDGTGTLAITAALKNNSGDSANLPSPTVQAIYKDGTATTENAASPYTLAGKAINASYQPGAGLTAVYVLAGVPKPTAENPVTKIVFRQSYTGLKPELVRILDPNVATN